MEDTILRYGIQFGTITAASMGLAEWLTPPAIKARLGSWEDWAKRLSSLVYAWGLGGLGWMAGLVQLPGQTAGEVLAGVTVMACCASGAAHLVHSGAQALRRGQKEGG